ncbi:hypothetical protein [Jiangella rhizosphaerae]|uniref:Uncharacterized protein n=1 Tax=Jiangella rhizosphaerae TaxID=2293569 RepID=A0A418KG35_9ACTN|nr:hypothetical protein [Jiangella rhizosphaerae]RIQ10846.1 hypothetical protein DY240_31165 [Jiangella rhizosphaerae]
MITPDGPVNVDALAAALPGLAGDPALIEAAAQLAHLHADHDRQDDSYSVAATALTDALVATPSPAVFADAVRVFLSSPALLEAAAAQLGLKVLEQATPPAADASGPEILRAADALEVATQLRLGGWVLRWDLFTLLSSYDGAGPEPYARAALRVVQACFEQWPEAVDLIPVARRITGLDPAETSAGRDEGAVAPSDAGVALARISILQSLRARDPASAVGHLDDATTYLGAVLEHDDRPDARVTAAVSQLLRGLIENQSVDSAVVGSLTENVRELRHFRFERGHWAADVAATTWASWARLSNQLAHAQELFAEPSWLHAVDVIHDLVCLYQASSASAGFRRDEDGRAVEVLVGPVIEDGFAAEVALMHQLKQRVAEMEAARDDGTATEAELSDLPVAIRIRDAAQRQLNAGAPLCSPKGSAGTEVPAEETGGGGLGRVATAEERVWAVATQRRRREGLASASNVVNTTLQRVWSDLRASGDYTGSDDVAEAVELVTSVLMSFLWDRNAVGPSEAPYLFADDASEEDLARDLRQFVRARGYLHGVDTEIRHVGGGRVDIRFAFPGFNLYVELKQDASYIPVPNKASYLNQAATYQVGEPRVGFLLVLKHTPKKSPPAFIGDSVEVVEVTDAAGKPRHVVAFTLSGSRTVPSDM